MPSPVHRPSGVVYVQDGIGLFEQCDATTSVYKCRLREIESSPHKLRDQWGERMKDKRDVRKQLGDLRRSSMDNLKHRKYTCKSSLVAALTTFFQRVPDEAHVAIKLLHHIAPG